MSKYIVVDGCELNFTSIAEGNIIIKSSPSLKVKIKNKGVYSGNLDFYVTGYMDSVIKEGFGEGTIIPTSKKVFVDGGNVLLKEDKVSLVEITGVNIETGQSATVLQTIQISNAGQNIVKGE